MKKYQTIICCILLNIVTMLGLLCLFRITTPSKTIAAAPPQESSTMEASPTTTIPESPIEEETTDQPSDSSTTQKLTTLSKRQLKKRLSNTLFIGDSRTESLYKFTVAGEYSDFCCKPGYNISTIREQTVAAYPENSLFKTIRTKKYKTIYVCLGYNELGWNSISKFVEEYEKFFKDIHKRAPKSTIKVISILHINEESEILESYETNKQITEFNIQIQNMCNENGLSFIDLNPFFVDNTDNLPMEYTEDGIHFTAAFCKQYLNALLQ